MVILLLDWDLSGLLTSILAIYYQNIKSFNDGMLTALYNRIDDASLLIRITLASNFGNWNLLITSSNFSSFQVIGSGFFSKYTVFGFTALSKSAKIQNLGQFC